MLPDQDADAFCAGAEVEQAELRGRLTAATALLPEVAMERALKVQNQRKSNKISEKFL